MTVAELEARMSYDEYLRWRAFYAWEAWRQELELLKAKRTR
jgi:hypothetical protein